MRLRLTILFLMLACVAFAGSKKQSMRKYSLFAYIGGGIVVQNTDFIAAYLTVNTQTISNFTLSGGTKLVVTTGTEGGVATNVTFNGQALISIVAVADSVQNASIWYLDNPIASSGDVVVTYAASSSSSGMSALSISGAATGVLDFAGAQGTNSGPLTIESGSLVVGSFATNADTGTMIDPDDPSTDIFSVNINGAAGGNAASAYFIEPDPATRTSFGFTPPPIGTRPVAAAASFTSIQ